MLNDTLLEGNKALHVPAIYVGLGSKVEINRCDIKRNHALRVLYKGKYTGGEDAGIAITPGSKVTMNDVTIEGNIADGNSSAIGNSGILNLNDGTTITKNTAQRYSAIENSMLGVVNIHDGVHIFNNRDEQQPGEPVHSEGILNIE